MATRVHGEVAWFNIVAVIVCIFVALHTQVKFSHDLMLTCAAMNALLYLKPLSSRSDDSGKGV